MKKIIPFLRHEQAEVSTLAILQVTLDQDLDSSTIVKYIEEVTSAWINDTEEGKQAWQETDEDLNIGDLALRDKTYLKYAMEPLKEKGILDLKFIWCGDVEDYIEYDHILVDYETLT